MQKRGGQVPGLQTVRGRYSSPPPLVPTPLFTAINFRSSCEATASSGGSRNRVF